MIMFLFALAAAQPSQPPAPASINPYAADLFDQDSVLKAWALRVHDRNRDGWLTMFEAQAAANAFEELADHDGDGRIMVREFEDAKAYLQARYGALPE